MGDLVKLTGLWKSEMKNGGKMLSGSLNAITSLLIMPNTFKKEPKEPDYYLYLKPKEKTEKPAQEQAPAFDEELGF